MSSVFVIEKSTSPVVVEVRQGIKGDKGDPANADAVQADLTDHKNNTSNPHNTTAAQVGAYTTAQTDTAISTAIANLVDTAPSTLNTLNELAAALGDDPNFATTVTDSIAAKASIAQLQDYSFTPKVADIIAKGPWVDVRAFGAVGDGVTDNTTTIQAALDFAATNKCTAYFPPGTYRVTTIRIKNGTKAVVGEGIIKGLSADQTNALVTMDGPNLFGGIAVDGCYVSLNIDMSNGDGFGIKADACTNCTFAYNNIYSLTDNVVASRFGMYFWKGSNYNKIINNKIIGYENPTGTLSNILIAIFGEAEAFGGFFNSGTITAPTTPCVGNVVKNNTLLYGEVAVDLLACEGNIVTDNQCLKQKTRAIYCANSTNNCIVEGNNIVGFGSSAILLGYGAFKNKVSNNICKQISGYNSVGAEAAINVNTGAYDNEVLDNTIDSFTNYGVYLAVNVIGNLVDGNKISNYYLSAIALENEWQDTPPANAVYSRPNYATPGSVSPGATAWATKDTEKNVIQNNIISNSYTGREVGSIYVSQLGATYKTQKNVIQNNVMTHPQANNKPLYFFEEASGLMINNDLVNNRIKDVNTARLFFSRGKAHFTRVYGNDGLDFGSVNFTSGDTTPSVGIGGRFVCVNAAPTTITTFDDGFDGQIIYVKLNANTTIQYSGAAIFTKGSVNIVGTSATNEWVTFIRDNTVWRELSRSF